MTYNDYLPSDDEKLVGTYKVSFEIHVESQDELSLSDLTHDLSEGFERGFGDGFVNKVAALSIEKLSKKSTKTALKIGDKIRLIGEATVSADIYIDDGYVFVGNPNEISEKLTSETVNINVSAGSTGWVNKINKDGSLEIADLDTSYVNAALADLGVDTAISIDLITVKAELIEKIDSEEVK